jgi:ABC-type transport system substrate-binding protein
MRALRVMGILLVASLFAMPSLIGSIPVHAQSSANLTIGVVTEPPNTWFQTPGNWGGQNTLTQVPYLFCYSFGIGGVAQPDLCTVPQAISGTNDTQWIVNLRSANYKWSDGVPINSTDLAYSYGVFLTHGPYANLSYFDVWGNLRDKVQSVSIVNSTAIKLTMFAPFPLFVMLTWLYEVYPYHYYKQFTGNNTLQTTSILGGPGDTAFVPQGFTAGSNTLELVANPYSPSWNGTSPTYHSVTIQFFTSDQSLVNAIAAGSIDGGAIEPSDVAALASASSVATSPVPSIYQMQFFINPVGYPYNNTAFRQALMYLLPKANINSLLYNGTADLGNPLLLTPSAYNTYWPGASTPDYQYNPTTAATLLSQAGLTKNTAGQWAMSNGTVLTVQFESANDQPDQVRAAQQIQSSMEAAGLQVNLKLVDLNTATNDKYNAPGNFKVILYTDAYFPSPFKWMRNPVNLPFGWSNSTFKTIFAESLVNTDPAGALTQLKQALNILANEAVTNSILFVPSYVAYNTATFSMWQPAIDNAINYNVFYNQLMAENVFTSVVPAGSTTTTTTTPSQTTTTTTTPSQTTTTTTPGQTTTTTTSGQSGGTSSNDYILYGAVILLVVIVVGAVVYRSMRKPGKVPAT